MGLLSNLASRNPPEPAAPTLPAPRLVPVRSVSDADSAGRDDGYGPGARRLPVFLVTESACGHGGSVME